MFDRAPLLECKKHIRIRIQSTRLRGKLPRSEANACQRSFTQGSTDRTTRRQSFWYFESFYLFDPSVDTEKRNADGIPKIHSIRVEFSNGPAVPGRTAHTEKRPAYSTVPSRAFDALRVSRSPEKSGRRRRAVAGKDVHGVRIHIRSYMMQSLTRNAEHKRVYSQEVSSAPK